MQNGLYQYGVAVAALVGGHVQVVSQTPEWKEHVLAGKLRLLVACTDQRMKAFPHVPTLKEKGITFSVPSELGFMGPAGLPMVLALVLGPMMENALRWSMILSNGSASIFFTRPISLVICLLVLTLLILPMLPWIKRKREVVGEMGEED